MSRAVHIRFKKPTMAAAHGAPVWPKESSLMEALLSAGVPVASSCRGDGVCGKCRLIIDKTGAALQPPSSAEQAVLGKAQASPTERLSCQLREPIDITVDASYW